MSKKVLIIDTSILCVWLQIPGFEDCGPNHDKWDFQRVDDMLEAEQRIGSTFVLPLATIIESGNHISQSGKNRKVLAEKLGKVMKLTADQATPWAAFEDQNILWSAEQLRILADTWPTMAARHLSLGDATIIDVAAYYAKMGRNVEVVTGDQGLKVYQPTMPALIPRRRKR